MGLTNKGKCDLGCFLVIIGFLGISALAGGSNPGEIYAEKQAGKEMVKKSGKGLQVELYGGFSTLNPGNLNLLAEADEKMRTFFYEDYYSYLQNDGKLQTWNREELGEYRRIRSGNFLGFRLKYRMNESLAISLGFMSLSKTQDSRPNYLYSRIEYYGSVYADERQYFIYSLSAQGYAPMVGVHLGKRISDVIGIEGYLALGPLFAACSYKTHWESRWLVRWSGYNYTLYRDEGMLEEQGKGIGIALDAGMRINLNMGKTLGLFLEAGYAYQSAANISGGGKEVRGATLESWQGEWAIKAENIQTPWGKLEIEFPTSYWPGGTEDQGVKDFRLDLSGFQLRAGVFFRFW